MLFRICGEPLSSWGKSWKTCFHLSAHCNGLVFSGNWLLLISTKVYQRSIFVLSLFLSIVCGRNNIIEVLQIDSWSVRMLWTKLLDKLDTQLQMKDFLQTNFDDCCLFLHWARRKKVVYLSQMLYFYTFYTYMSHGNWNFQRRHQVCVAKASVVLRAHCWFLRIINTKKKCEQIVNTILRYCTPGHRKTIGMH